MIIGWATSLLKFLIVLHILSYSALPQLPLGSVGPFSAGGTGTFTLVQAPTHSGACSSSPCTNNLTQTPATGNLELFMVVGNDSQALPTTFSQGTWTRAFSCMGGPSNGNDENFCFFITPANNTTAWSGTSFTNSWSAAPATTASQFWEFHPSANSGNVKCDSWGTLGVTASGNAVAGPAFTLSVSNAAIVGGTNPNGTITSVSGTGYVSDGIGAFFGFAHNLNSSTGAAVTWNGSSLPANIFPSAIACGWNGTTPLEQAVDTFDGTGLTSGTTITSSNQASLNTGHFGWQGGAGWSVNPATGSQITIDSASSMPFQNAVGRLAGDGSSPAAGCSANCAGITITGTGSGCGTQSVQTLDYATNEGSITSATLGTWFQTDRSATDNCTLDIVYILNDGSAASVQLDSNGAGFYWALETPPQQVTSAVGSTSYNTSTGCGSGGSSAKVFIQLQRNTQGLSHAKIYNDSGALCITLDTTIADNAGLITGYLYGHQSATEGVPAGKHDRYDSPKFDLAATFPVTQ